MEEVEDDFGELYADAEVQVSCAIEEAEDNNETSKFDDLNKSKTTTSEAEFEVEEKDDFISENDSDDSEDDLHIVLNDEDCGGLMATSIPNKDDDDLAIVTQADGKQMLSDGVEQSERGGGNGIIKGNHYYTQHYSQYKYVRPHAAAYPFNAKINDWDANGCNQHLGSSSGTVASSGSTILLVTSQTGCDFSLPRNRSILDVNIDAFEQKPWKHPGADISDFFNFGLDEDSWKHYCNSVENVRQQTTVATKTNQVYGYGHQIVAPETVGGEYAEVRQDGGVSLVLNDSTKGERKLDIPKGRAIQVDGGLGERRPSMDTRRPRNQDSDVVIQISIQDNMECSSSSSKEELGHSDDSQPNVSEIGGSVMHVAQNAFSAESTDKRRRHCRETYVKDLGMRSLKRCSQPKSSCNALLVDPDGQENEEILDVNDGCPLHEAKIRVSGETFEAMEATKDSKEGNQRSPFKVNPCTLEAESSFGDRIQYTSDSHIEASSIRDGYAKTKLYKPARRRSLNSLGGLRAQIPLGCNRSNSCGSYDRKTELGNNKDDLGNQNRLRWEQDSSSRVRFHSFAETRNHVGDSEGTPVLNRKKWHDENHLRRSSLKRRERLYENDYYDGEDLPYYRETEISFGYRREKLAGKSDRDAYTEYFREKDHTKFRNEMDPYLRRYWGERDFFIGKTFNVRKNEARRKEHLSPERRYSSRRLNGITNSESTSLIPECSSFYTEKEWHRWQRRKRNDEECFRRGTEDEGFVLEHRYREQYIQEKCARPVPYYDREREYLNENYEKHESYKCADRRDRYAGSPYMDIVIDSPEYWRSPDYESFSPHREFHVTYGEGCCDASSLRPAIYDSRRSDGEEMDLWRQTHCERGHNDDRFGRTCRDSHNDDSIIYPDDYFSNEGREYVHQSKALNLPEDRSSSRQRNECRLHAKEGSLSYEQSSRQGDSNIKMYESSQCGMFFDKNWLEHDRNRKINGKAKDFAVNTRITSSFRVVDKDEDEQAAPRHKKSVDLRFIGWEEKACGRLKGRDSIAKEQKVEKSGGGVVEEEEKKEEKKQVGCENGHILETLAKMERRRERFKEPPIAAAAAAAAPDKPQQPADDIVLHLQPAECNQQQQQRPIRKRRWGGS